MNEDDNLLQLQDGEIKVSDVFNCIKITSMTRLSVSQP